MKAIPILHLLGGLCALSTGAIAFLHLISSEGPPKKYVRLYALLAAMFFVITGLGGINKFLAALH